MGSLEADEVYALLKKKIGQGGGGTSDYSDLENLPQINGVELKGNKSTADLKINDVFLVGETTTFGQLSEAVENGQVCVRVKNGWFWYLFGAGLMSDGIIGSFWMNASAGPSDGETTAKQEYVLITGGADDILVQGEETVVPLPEGEDVSNYIKIFNPSSTFKEIFQNSSAPILLVIAEYDTGGDIRNIVTQITNLYSDPDGNHITLKWLDGDKIKYMYLNGVAATSTIADAMSESDWNLLSTPIPEISTSSLNVTIYPNAFYKWVDTTVSALTLQLGEGEEGQVNEYHFAFKSGETATNLSLPASVQTDIVIEPNMYYECSILNNMMVFREWPLEAK